MITLDVAGLTLRIRDSGGAGLPVLLTHGIGGSLELWNRQFETADPTLRLIAWDLPGHGLSGSGPDDSDLDAMARRGWQLLDALGVGGALLVGNSLGGAVSLRMAGQAPHRAQGLLLAAAATLGRDTVLPFRLMTLPGLGTLMSRPGPMAVQQQIRAIVHRPQAITAEVREAIIRNVMRPGAADRFLALLRRLTDLGGQRAAFCQQSQALLRGLRVPVVLVHGAQDSVLPVAHSRQAQAAVAGAQLEVLADCGHTPQLEQPAAFQRLLSTLAGRLNPAAAAGESRA